MTSLVAADTDVNAAGYMSFTLLHWSAVRGFIPGIVLLLGAGAEVNALNDYSSTPLDLAIRGAQESTADTPFISTNQHRVYPTLLRAGGTWNTIAQEEFPGAPYLAKVRAAGGFENYRRLHLDKLTMMFAPAPPVSARRRRSQRLTPFQRLPLELVRRVMEFWVHAGVY